MTARRATRALAVKELRALLPLWGVSMIGLMAIALIDRVPPAALFALPGAALAVLAPVALGAIAMGHEFRAGTLAAAMTLPISRTHLLAVRLAVLATLLLLMVATAWWAGVRSPWVWLPVACGLGLAPYFVLASRSELGGMVFAGAVPALLILGGAVAAEMVHGPSLDARAAGDALRNLIVAVGTAGASSVALFATVRRFMRLEVADGVGPRTFRPRALPSVRAAGAPGRRVRSALETILRKELRLQALPAMALGLTAVLFFVLVQLPDEYGSIERIVAALQPMFVLLLAILAGAIAGAEERHLGTWASSVLQPVALWQQWTIKLAVVVTFSALAGVFLGGPGGSQSLLGRWGYPLYSLSVSVAAILAATLSLYCSSFCRRSVTGFLVSAGASVIIGLGTVLFVGAFAYSLFALPALAFRPVIAASGVGTMAAREMADVVDAIAMCAVVGTVAWLAFKNYRSLQHARRTLITQVAAILVAVALALTVSTIASGFAFEVMQHNYFQQMRERGR